MNQKRQRTCPYNSSYINGRSKSSVKVRQYISHAALRETALKPLHSVPNPLLSTVCVVVLALSNMTRPRPFPEYSLEPFGPEAAKLPVEECLDQPSRIHKNAVLPEVTMAKENNLPLQFSPHYSTAVDFPLATRSTDATHPSMLTSGLVLPGNSARGGSPRKEIFTTDLILPSISPLLLAFPAI